MFNYCIRILIVLAILSCNSFTFADNVIKSKKLVLNNARVLEGDVYNQSDLVIITNAEGFSPIISPHAYSSPFKVYQPFTRVIYTNKMGRGCVFEFSINGEGGADLDYYSVNRDDNCDIKKLDTHITLIVG